MTAFIVSQKFLVVVVIKKIIVPRQWKAASICPVQKVTAPKEHVDFRPISVTLVLSRILERLVVRDYIYQALLSPPLPLSISDQFVGPHNERPTPDKYNDCNVKNTIDIE